MSELRWHPFLGEWVITATHRQERTFLPPADYCPLCPTKPGGFPTEVPAEEYDFAVFENRFPSLRPQPDVPAVEGSELYPVRPNQGVCEVVLYSQLHDATLAGESPLRIRRLIEVWTDRYRELGERDYVEYVYIFENKGQEIGVTLTHPHGQIYAYPFLPPLVQRQLQHAKIHQTRTGRCLGCDVVRQEIDDGRRILGKNDDFVAYVPFFARWPYEVHISPLTHAQSLLDLEYRRQCGLAEILKSVLVAYDALYDRSFPYIMALQQAPSDGMPHDEAHFRIEFYPPLRKGDRLKYLAGSETGAGAFINDTLPENTAQELRSHWKSYAGQAHES